MISNETIFYAVKIRSFLNFFNTGKISVFYVHLISDRFEMKLQDEKRTKNNIKSGRKGIRVHLLFFKILHHLRSRKIRINK